MLPLQVFPKQSSSPQDWEFFRKVLFSLRDLILKFQTKHSKTPGGNNRSLHYQMEFTVWATVFPSIPKTTCVLQYVTSMNMRSYWELRPLLLLLLLSHFSHVRLCVTPQTVAHQAPPSLGFSRQEHWSGLPFPSPLSLLFSHKYPVLKQLVKKDYHFCIELPWHFSQKSTD